MSKKEKLRDRFFSRPKDFTWDELESLLTGYGFELKYKGIRCKFVHPKAQLVINLHKPHPDNIIKMYIIQNVIDTLQKLENQDE